MSEHVEFIGYEPNGRRNIVFVSDVLMQSMMQVAAAMCGTNDSDEIDWDAFVMLMRQMAEVVTTARLEYAVLPVRINVEVVIDAPFGSGGGSEEDEG